MVKSWQKKLLTLDLDLRRNIEEKLGLLFLWKTSELDIKPLKWKINYYRCRIWKIRIVYKYVSWKIEVLDIWFRWDVYKNI